MAFNKIYTLEKAYVHPLTLVLLSGGWHIETKTTWKRIAYFFYSFFILSNIYLIAVVDVIVIYKVYGDLHDLMETLCVFVLGICTLMKHTIIITQALKIKQIDYELENNLFSIRLSPEDDEEHDRLNNARRIMVILCKFFSVAIVPCLGIQLAYPLVEEPEKKRFPAPFWLPFDIKRSPVYETIYSYICILSISFASMVIGIDMLLYGILVRLNAQFEVLRLQFEKLGKFIRDEMSAVDNYGFHHVNDSQKYIRMTLRQNFRYHQAILRISGKMMDVFSWSLFVHMTAVSVQICIVLVEAIKTKTNTVTMQQLQRIPFCAGILVDTWLFCLLGTWIENQSIYLSEEAYGLPWYDLDVPTRRMLLFFMRRTQKASQLMAGHTVPLNLTYFLSILNASYSFYSVVRHTMK